MCNMKSPNVIVVPITSKEKRWDWLHVEIPTSTGMEIESFKKYLYQIKKEREKRIVRRVIAYVFGDE